MLCLLVLLFAVSVVGCLLGYSSCLVVWIPLFLDPSAGAFGRFDLAALCGCRTLNFCLFVCLFVYGCESSDVGSCDSDLCIRCGGDKNDLFEVDTTESVCFLELFEPCWLWVPLRSFNVPITKWPHQSGAPVGAAPPTRSQLRLQRRTQTPVQNSHNGCHQPTLDPLLANVCQASPFRLAMC